MRKARDAYQTKLINQLSNVDSSSTSWWKLCNQISGIKPIKSGIPPLIKNDTLIFEDTDKANELNDFFISQTELDDSRVELQKFITPEHNLSNIVISELYKRRI